ncbi:MAG: DUF2073 domain-containing protein [Candidatus Woesearchaeota archaeon]
MLTLQFIPYSEISQLEPEERIKKLLSLAKDEKIILIEGRIKETEKAELIKRTMENIDEKFTGIELEDVSLDKKNKNLYEKIHKFLVKLLLGNRDGFTIIGPANIVREIKKDPDKIQLYTKDISKSKK